MGAVAPDTARTLGRRLVLLAAVAGLLVVGSIWLGPQGLGWDDIVAGPFSGSIFWQYRVPRTLLAAVAGAGLALGGLVYQTIFRNPLAEPYTLGVAGGASLGAAFGMLTGRNLAAAGGKYAWLGAHAWLGVPRLTVLAFLGALAVMALVWLLGRGRTGARLTRVLLAGVCAAYLCAAGILLITYLSDPAITSDIVVWMMGSLDILRPRAALEVTFVLVPVTLLALLRHRDLDLLNFGPLLAASRGLRVEATIWTSYLLVGLLVATIVANCGPIGFVGLMVPHFARVLLGVRMWALTLGAVLVGAAFLAVCDGVARSMLPGRELPVGVVTNILGAVFFLYLLATQADGQRA